MTFRKALAGFIPILLAAMAWKDANATAWGSLLHRAKNPVPVMAPSASPAPVIAPAVTPEASVSLLEQETLTRRIRSRGYEYQDLRLRPDVKVISAAFFSRYAKDLKLGKDDQFHQLTAIPNKMVPGKAGTVTHYQQYYKDLPVVGTAYIHQTDADGTVFAATGKYVPSLNVDTNPTLSEAQALEAAKKSVPTTKTPKGILEIAFKNSQMTVGNAVLVYQFDIESEQSSQSFRVQIDAHTGELVSKISNRIPDVVDWHENIDDCNLIRSDGGDVSIRPCDKSTDGKFYLMCQIGAESCYAPLKVIDGRRPNPQAHNEEDPNQDYVFADEDNQTPPIFGEEFGGEGEEEDRVGDSVYDDTLFAFRFFSINFEWAGFDGLGKSQVFVYLKPITSEDTAGFYSPDSDTITVDPNKMTQDREWNLFTMGHEFTHAVIQHVLPNNVYSGEMASLNESFSDIFGSDASLWVLYESKDTDAVLKHLLLREKAPATYQGNYYIGTSDCGGTSSCYHTPDHQTVSCDDPNSKCDPDHSNGGVQNFMFYLLVNGGEGTNDLQMPYSVSGIGVSEALKIAFQTIRARLLPASTYQEARDAWIAAATDLYGANSGEVFSVTKAWQAVGIGEDNGDTSVTPNDGTTGVWPWSAQLSWPVRDKERAWQVQISTSPQFDKNIDPSLQTSPEITEAAGASSPIPQTNLSGPIQQPDSTKEGLKGRLKGTGVPLTNPSFGVIPAHSWTSFDLRPNTNYFWRVRAKGNENFAPKGSLKNPGEAWGDWSPIHYFQTDKVTTKLISPNVGAKVYPWPPTVPGDKGAEFKWEPVSGATEFILLVTEPSESGECPVEKDPEYAPPVAPAQIDKGTTLPGFTRMESLTSSVENMSFWSVTLNGMVVTPKKYSADVTATYSHPLKVGKPYCWWVLPIGPEDPATHERMAGSWSNNGKGQLVETSIPQARLISPKAGGTDVFSPWEIPIQWERTDGAAEYELSLLKNYTKDANGVIQGTPLLNQSGLKGTKTTVALDAAQAGTDSIYVLLTPKGPPPYNEYGFEAEPRSFRVDANKTKPELSSPQNGSWIDYKHVPNTSVFVPGDFFMWKQVEGANDYTLNFYPFLNGKCDTTAPLPGLSFPHANGVNPTNPAYIKFIPTPPQGIAGDHNYDRCWTVQAMKAVTGPNGTAGVLNGIPSDPFLLGVGPDEPVLTNPPNPHDPATGAVATSNVAFTWKSEWAPDGYDLFVTQIDTNTIIWRMTDIPFASATGTTKTVPGFDPKGGIQYVWSVIGKKKATPGIVTPNGYEAKQGEPATFKTKLNCSPVATPTITFPMTNVNYPMTGPGVLTALWTGSGGATYNLKLISWNKLAQWCKSYSSPCPVPDFNTALAKNVGVVAQYSTTATSQAFSVNPNDWYAIYIQATNACSVSPWMNTFFTTTPQ